MARHQQLVGANLRLPLLTEEATVYLVSDEGERIRIHELINLHGHLMDEAEFDRLDELLTDDVVYDVSALGGEDQVRRTGQGWRIAVHRVLPRKAPLRPSAAGGPEHRV